MGDEEVKCNLEPEWVNTIKCIVTTRNGKKDHTFILTFDCRMHESGCWAVCTEPSARFWVPWEGNLQTSGCACALRAGGAVMTRDVHSSLRELLKWPPGLLTRLPSMAARTEHEMKLRKWVMSRQNEELVHRSVGTATEAPPNSNYARSAAATLKHVRCVSSAEKLCQTDLTWPVNSRLPLLLDDVNYITSVHAITSTQTDPALPSTSASNAGLTIKVPSPAVLVGKTKLTQAARSTVGVAT